MSTVSVPTLLPGEVRPGGSYCSEMPKLGFLTVKTPSPVSLPVRPPAYSCGFNRQGEIIGANATVPYPGELPKHHDIPFIRCVEWAAHLERNTQQTKQHEIEHDPGCPAEIAEYFTVENDEGYRQWAEKKKSEEKKKEKQIQQQQQQNCKVIHAQQQLPGHFMPSRFQTANQTYGSYIDLLPKYPAVYPLPAKLPSVPVRLDVKIEKSNISTHAPTTNHPFLFSQQLINPISTTPSVIKNNCDSHLEIANQCKILTRAHQTHSAHTPHGLVRCEREKGFTFPVYSNTGLQINRHVSTGKQLFPISEQAVPGKVPYVPTRPRKNMIHAPYCLRLPRDPRINPDLVNRHIIYEAIELPQLLG